MSVSRSMPLTVDASREQRGRRPVRLAAGLSVFVAVTAVVLGLLAPGLLVRHQLLVLVLGFVVGLPHGAVDHLVPFWAGWVRRGPVPMLAVLAGYVSVAVLTWVGLHWAGMVVLPLLLAVSVVHFGAGDLLADRDDHPDDPSPSAVALAVGVLARGGPVVAAPLLLWPEQAERALASVQVGFTMPAPDVRVLLACVIAGCVAAACLADVRRGRPGSAVEVVLLVLLFVAVPPLAAFGLYFGAWHGLRHTARLIAGDPRNRADLEAGRLSRPLLNFGLSAALPTLVAAATAAVLVVAASRDAGLSGTVFTVLLSLTVPHLVVVAALDVATSRRSHPRPRTRSVRVDKT